MNKQLIILDYHNVEIIFSKVSQGDNEEEIEEYITESLGLKLSEVEWMSGNDIKIKW